MDPYKKTGVIFIAALLVYIIIGVLVIGGIVGISTSKHKIPYGVMLGTGFAAIIVAIEYKRNRDEKAFTHITLERSPSSIPVFHTRNTRTQPPIPPSRPNTPTNPNNIPPWVKPEFDEVYYKPPWWNPFGKTVRHLVRQ